MKNGYRVFDADTHVNPAAEVLERYIDPDFRPRLAELAQYRLTASRAAEGGDSLHNYRVATKYYRRILGEAGPRESFSGRESRWRGSKMPRPGVQDDQAANRVADMDDEGWRAAADHDLPVAHHSSTWNPPYYPGYRDVWDNIFLGRMASHPWGAMRFVASFIGGGIFDRYPAMRLAVLECGFGWLPFWARRLDEQAVYVGGTAPLKHRPSDYIGSGRFFCSIEHQEGEDMFAAVTSFLGEDLLMYASDYPHSECQFPDSIDNILAWQTLKPEKLGKSSSGTTPPVSSNRPRPSRDAVGRRRQIPVNREVNGNFLVPAPAKCRITH